MQNYGQIDNSLTKKVNFIFFVLVAVIVFLILLIINPTHGGLVKSNLSKFLRIDFINVGTGDSILIRTPMGRNFLVDGGTSVSAKNAKKAKRELVQDYLHNLGIRKLDGIVLTNYHNEHLGGLIPVLRLFSVKKVWECGGKSKTDLYKSFKKLCSVKKIKRITAEAGMILDWGNELFVQVLHPDGEIKNEDMPGVNNQSVVIALRYGKVQTLLTSDIEKLAEKELLKYGSQIKSQILKVPFHGSGKSNDLSFFKLVYSRVAIIPVSANNPFKYPSKEILETLKRFRTKIYRSDVNGNIKLTIGGKTSNDYRIDVDH